MDTMLCIQITVSSSLLKLHSQDINLSTIHHDAPLYIKGGNKKRRLERLQDRIQAGCNWQTWSDKVADVAGSRSVGLWWIQMMMVLLNWGLWPP
ncbi:hypothetical protein YC2023_035721 [Brassica napus]